VSDSFVSGLWLTIIDMTVVFIVLYVLALIIKVIKVAVAPFDRGNGPNGGNGRANRAEAEAEAEFSGDVEPVEAAEGAEGMTPEELAVITSAVAAYLERPAAGLAIRSVTPYGRREESPWAMAGRTRIMQSREIARRRATA